MLRGLKIFFLISLLGIRSLYSQNNSEKTVDEILNLIIDGASIENEDSQLYDLIEQLIENPININEATKSQLLKIPFMDIESAEIILKYRLEHGKIFSINELKMIEGLSYKTSKTLKFFIKVENRSKIGIPSFWEFNSLKLRSRVTKDIQKRKGFVDGDYTGSSIKSYNRIKIQINPNIQAGGLIEKDAGEVSYWDFYSAHLLIKNQIPNTEIILGDYTVEFGQGLSLWSPYSTSKGNDATNTVIKRNRNINPYTSSGENNFFRGGAFHTIISYFSATAFYSNINLDATISDENTFSSIKVDGFHRTGNELLKKNSIQDKTMGIILSYSLFNIANIGVLYYEKSFNQIFNPSNYSLINSKNFNFASLTYNAALNKIFLTGELSFFQDSYASINSIQLVLAKSFVVTAIIRNYPYDYFSFYAAGFGEKSTTNNEFGIYTGFKWRSNLGEINFYIDQFKFPHPSNNVPLPSNGNELSLSYLNQFNNYLSLYLRYFNENKEVLNIVDAHSIIIQQKINKIRGEIIFQANQNIRLKSRVELLFLSQNQTIRSETGFLLFQDIQIKIPTVITLYSRIIFFQTDSYSSRIYQFENDLNGVMNNPALFGTGIKWYFLIKYNLMDFVTFSIKYSELYKPNEITLSSGYNLIQNNLDNRISFQADISF